MNHLHANRDESMSCIGYFTGAHGANHFDLASPRTGEIICGGVEGHAPEGLTAGVTTDCPRLCNTADNRECPSEYQSSPAGNSDFSIMHRPSIIRSSEERQTRYAAALTCEGGGLDRFIDRVSYIVDREMAEPSDFDHDSFAASEFAAGLGGGR